jgi:predicted dehydrogenase
MEWRVFGGADEGLILRGAQQGDEDFQVLEIPEEYVRDLDPAKGGMDVFVKQLAGPRLFVDAILRDYMPDPNFRDGYKVQQVLDAAIESHNTGRRIEISS